MLNFNDTTLMKLEAEKQIRDKMKYDVEKMKFYNSRYSKYDLSDFILVNKKPRKYKPRNKYSDE